MLFADSQIFGRFAKKAMSLLGQHAERARFDEVVSGDLLAALSWLKQRVLHGPPKIVSITEKKTMLLFLGGACEHVHEQAQCSVGGVLTDKADGPLACFGEPVPRDAVLKWSKAKTAKQLNFEAEIMPLLVALTCWPDRLEDCLLLVFIDNDAARHAWVSATAKTKHARNMIHSALSLEAQLGIVSYFCRVPTHSNIADAPSRLDFKLCQEIGA